jgi:hypothetical protein
VPEGLTDRSQAVYCLERYKKGDPSQRDGMIRSLCIESIRALRRYANDTHMLA